MAATLMYIKSRELLPVDQQAQTEGEDEGEDPRWELIRQLVEYKKFKDAAAQLQALEARQEDIFPRLPGKPEFAPESPAAAGSLASSTSSTRSTSSSSASASARTSGTFLRTSGRSARKSSICCGRSASGASLRFSDLFDGVTSRSEVVVTFLALLELIRLRQVAASPARAVRRDRNLPAWPRRRAAPPEAGAAAASTPRAGASAPRLPPSMELKFILEAILFSAQKPLSLKELRDVFAAAAEYAEGDETVRALKKVKEGELTAALEELARDQAEAKRSYRLACVAGAWQFVTEPEYAPWLKALVGHKAPPAPPFPAGVGNARHHRLPPAHHPRRDRAGPGRGRGWRHANAGSSAA